MRALIVDDSRAIRSIIRSMLVPLGFQTFEAGHGLEALGKLKELGPVELALIDWNMPEMGGLDLVKAMRADRAYDSTLLMMVTTETDIAEVTKALEVGANEYLMKPFNKELMLDKLAILGFSQPPAQ
jgi:two-component system chemotaxis response regulator CheY